MFNIFNRGYNKKSGITLVAGNCQLIGDVHFTDQLLVNGVVNGNIRAESGTNATLTISEKGEVRGEIRVPNVIVNGSVDGDIHSEKHIELSAKAEVSGNVYYKVIEMVMGSRVDGQFVHVDGEVEKLNVSISPKSRKKEDESPIVAKIVS
tara:strand:+ start:167 stop:616 length:450 start_codon:yes stop_codon:yes gene_type:complete